MLSALILQLIIVTSAPKPEAVQLNTEGFRLYQQGDLKGAFEKFKQAVGADDDYALAHYNAAATLSRIDLCDRLSESLDIIEELRKAIALDPRRRARALVDADFNSQHNTLAWRRLVLNLSAKDLKTALEGTAFTSYGGWGASGNSVELRFMSGGKLVLGLRELTDSGTEQHDLPGTWRLEGNTLHVRMNRKADAKYSGKAIFNPADDSLEFPGLGKLVNYLSGACDA